MLLLVIDAELDQPRTGPSVQAARAETPQCLVDVRAIGTHLVGGRSRQQPALAARGCRAPRPRNRS